VGVNKRDYPHLNPPPQGGRKFLDTLSMRAVIQRVKSAEVYVDGRLAGKIGNGLLVFVGVGKGDGEDDISYLSAKLPDLRIFEDPSGKFNLSLQEIKGEILVVSQFTLYGDCRKGRRPSFTEAEEPTIAKSLYERLILKLKGQDIPVQTGEFQAKMEVHLINDGPVTLLLDSKKSPLFPL
jgi:D-tyrosyl-tRNA(Tyr) deacylase